MPYKLVPTWLSCLRSATIAKSHCKKSSRVFATPFASAAFKATTTVVSWSQKGSFKTWHNSTNLSKKWIRSFKVFLTLKHFWSCSNNWWRALRLNDSSHLGRIHFSSRCLTFWSSNCWSKGKWPVLSSYLKLKLRSLLLIWLMNSYSCVKNRGPTKVLSHQSLISSVIKADQDIRANLIVLSEARWVSQLVFWFSIN